MGKKNNVMCDYLEKPERFADFINGSLYGGKQVLLPGQVMGSQTVYSKTAKSRDILKKVCRASSISMSSAEFLSGMKKEDRLNPVTTIVFYHGGEENDGCRNLHSMLNWEKENEIFKQYISDYHINLVTLDDLNENCFQTGVRELIGFLKRRKNRTELQRYCAESKQRMLEMDEETFDTISVMINKSDFLEQKKSYQQEGGKVNMCQAMEEWKEELLNEGMERGLEQGIERGIEAFVLDNLEEGISKERILEKLQKRFEIDAEKAQNYFAKYAVCK